MLYSLDTEFQERFYKPLLGPKRHFLDLISIGIVGEDGREYEAVCSDYNYNKTSHWVREHVIIPLYLKTVHGDNRNRFGVHNFHYYYGKSKPEIAKEIIEFVNPDFLFPITAYNNSEFRDPESDVSKHFDKHNATVYDGRFIAQPQFCAYYGDYDWVLFCSLFGTMMDLPPGFPKYCIDVKQMLDEAAERLPDAITYNNDLQEFETLAEKANFLKNDINYEHGEHEHDALHDARWTMRLRNRLELRKQFS